MSDADQLTDTGSPAVEQQLRIGEVARAAGVSTRTVRYYEQVGLLGPAARTPGGTRTYTKRDVDVLLRIRELQGLMGFDLDQIRTILAAESRMDELRAEWHAAPEGDLARILHEAVQINKDLRSQVEAKIATLGDVLDDLDARAIRYREVATEHGIDLSDA
jgi:DNA-binding transcriptional MerR regulator